MKPNPIKKVLILVSILAIPGFLFFYLLPHFAKNRYKSLPYFGEKRLSGTFHSVKGKKIPDTIYHVVPDFDLVNQESKALQWKSFENKIVVLNLFNANAGSQQANSYVKQLSDSYEHKPLVRFLSIAVKQEAPVALKRYADSLGVLASKWDLVSGDTVKTYPWIRKGLLLDVVADQQDGKTSYIFSNKLLLIDHLHRIRGVYDADNQQSTARLEDEIKVLIAEYLRNLKDGR